jgi:type IX secretion system PorP/SprF family membrane protein
MRTIRNLVLLTLTALSATLSAQDIHYTMFDMAPLNLNPALSGAYEGTFRLGGIYRDQWNGVNGVNGYRTPSLYIDAPLFRVFGQSDWIGGGLSFLDDKAGSASLQRTNIMLSLAYHVPLTRSRKVYLSVGAQGGFVQNRIDASKLRYEDALRGNVPTTDVLQNTNVSYADFAGGALLNVVMNSKLNFNFGFSTQHISGPKINFTSRPENLARRFIAHTQWNIDLNHKFSLLPQGYYQFQAKAQEMNLQTLLGIHLNPARDMTFLVGGGYRLTPSDWGIGDAAIARLGFNWKGFKAGLSYDFTSSGLQKALGRTDALEVALCYTAKIYPRQVLPARIICPRF